MNNLALFPVLIADRRTLAVSLAPLLDAAPAIPLHAFAAMTAFALGVVQFAAPKGTLPHRTLVPGITNRYCSPSIETAASLPPTGERNSVHPGDEV
jgi:hypothetical protein